MGMDFLSKRLFRIASAKKALYNHIKRTVHMERSHKLIYYSTQTIEMQLEWG